jgi:CubicO group peptidase (beta-lactamase class C family)
MVRRLFAMPLGAIVVVSFALGLSPAIRGQDAPSLEQKVDAMFAKWTATTPGCAVGVSSGGRIVLDKAYGMADLEHDARNVADTIFEAGSVSKQFTAAAVLLLAREGKLLLDDPVRKYIPELPDYRMTGGTPVPQGSTPVPRGGTPVPRRGSTPITIRHMLQHTSGLRDWGEIEAIAGWPRTSRVYTHAHVLDIVSRQKALNFEPGTNWSYCNTGYNLAVILVSRVSGQMFADFCRTRIFEPLGMTRTSWRDDFKRVVKGRAIAYEGGRAGYRQDMPFENVHGNGGLLTTVGDLLRWNENAVTQKVGDAEFLRIEQEPGRFTDGRAHDYAMGLFIRTYKGLPEVNHSGSTAGYRAYLTRYPGQHLSVAVLCNVSSGTAERYAHAVADLYLGDAIKPAAGGLTGGDDVLITDTMKSRAGMYRNTVTGTVLTILFEKTSFRLEGGAAPANLLVPLTDQTFESFNGDRTFRFEPGGRLSVASQNGTTRRLERVEPATPTLQDLKVFPGTYVSDEAEVTLQVIVEGGVLKVTRRPEAKLTLRPLYKDAFAAQGLGVVRFHRGANGAVSGLSVTLDRVWDLRFARVSPRT